MPILAVGGALCLAVGGYLAASPNPVRKQISLAIKHAPLCLMENLGLVAKRRAHYTESAGTVDVLYCTPWEAPRYRGRPFPHPLVVLSDFGRVVQRFDGNGRLQWQTPLNMPRGLDVQGQHVYVGDGKQLLVLDLATGALLRRHTLPRHVLALRVLGGEVLVAYDAQGAGTVARYRQDGDNLLATGDLPQTFQYARGLDTDGKSLFVADTFGHRIVRIDLASGATLDETPSYFPNSVQLAGRRLLVAEEHLNVIGAFSLEPLALGELRAGCYGRTGAAGAFLAAARPGRIGPAGACALAPGEKLYSPNDARAVGEFMYVADTDAHRVAVFRNGQLWGELSGLNDPVSLRPLGGGSAGTLAPQ